MPQTPSQRVTRSGSNTSSLTLNDVKVLIEASQAETVKSFKKEMAIHGEMLQTLLSKVDELTKQNERLALKVADLEDKVEALSSKQPDGVDSRAALTHDTPQSFSPAIRYLTTVRQTRIHPGPTSTIPGAGAQASQNVLRRSVAAKRRGDENTISNGGAGGRSGRRGLGVLVPASPVIGGRWLCELRLSWLAKIL